MIFRYSLLWFLLAVIAILNGTLREKVYGKYFSELTSHQISTITGILLSGAVVYCVHRFWPIESIAQAWIIGVIWFISTVIFEFGFGHYAMGHSWAHLLRDYDLFQGRVWLVFLLWILVMPVVIYRLSGFK